jgi:hypothetical protein
MSSEEENVQSKSINVSKINRLKNERIFLNHYLLC